MVLGAGRGPLVEATLKAAERAEADGWQLLADMATAVGTWQTSQSYSLRFESC